MWKKKKMWRFMYHSIPLIGLYLKMLKIFFRHYFNFCLHYQYRKFLSFSKVVKIQFFYRFGFHPSSSKLGLLIPVQDVYSSKNGGGSCRLVVEVLRRTASVVFWGTADFLSCTSEHLLVSDGWMGSQIYSVKWKCWNLVTLYV